MRHVLPLLMPLCCLPPPPLLLLLLLLLLVASDAAAASTRLSSPDCADALFASEAPSSDRANALQEDLIEQFKAGSAGARRPHAMLRS